MSEDRFPQELDLLFASYRGAFGELEPSRHFLPNLWARIEQRQKLTYSFRRLASGYVTLAAALCLMLSAVLWTPSQPAQYAATYVDVLADDGADSDMD